MLAPERMRKVTVIGPKTVLEKTIRELHQLKAVHISDYQKGELDIGSPLERASRIAALLVTVKALSAALGIAGKRELSNGFRAVGVKNLPELERAVKKLNEDLSSILDGKKSAEDELRSLAAKESQLASIAKLGLRLDDFSGYKSLAYFFGTAKETTSLRKSLLPVTDKFELFSAESGGSFAVAVFVEAGKKASVGEVLAKHEFVELPLNGLEGMKGLPSQALEEIAAKKEKMHKKIDSVQKTLARMAVKWNDFLLLGEQLLEAELQKAEAPLKFAMSKSAFMINGWVPSGQLEKLEETLSRATGERIFVESGLPHHGDKVPVKLDNPKPARPFEFFLRLYALPKYEELDPTLLMLFTFPLFFGFILGDVGYGLVTFFLLLWLREKMPGSASLVNLMVPASLASILFGFLYGEVFGFEHAFGVEFPRLISRAHETNTMLTISIIIGLIHVNIGFVLGFINELRHKGLLAAVLGKASWIMLQVGAGILLAGARFGIPKLAGAGIILLSLAAIIYAEKLRGFFEVFGLLSNVLSYARLMGVGLASVVLAIVTNELAAEIAHAGIVGTVLAVIILFLGHTLNLALGLMDSFLQSLRLHYVEFFTKFFEGGAQPFRPFGAKGGD